MVIAVTKVDSPSATGSDIHAPFKPKILGKMNKQGIRNINCRVRLKKIDIFALPMD